MLRFRNRFRVEPCELGDCRCGRRLTRTVADGRETIIHELPWCEAFEQVAREVGTAAEASFHVALGNLATSESTIVADADRVEDLPRGYCSECGVFEGQMHAASCSRPRLFAEGVIE